MRILSILLAALTLIPTWAWADDGTTISLSPIWTTIADLAGTVAAAVVSTLAGYAIAWLSKRLNLTITADAQSTIDQAAQRAGGLAYAAIIAAGGKVTDPTVKNAAIAAGVNHVLASVPDALAKLGVTKEAVERLVTGELGKLLAQDPTVSPGAEMSTAAAAAIPVV